MPHHFHRYPPMPTLVFGAAGDANSTLRSALHRANAVAAQALVLPDQDGNFQLQGYLPDSFQRVLNPQANLFCITANSAGLIFEISEVRGSTADGFFGDGIPIDTLAALLHLWVEQQAVEDCAVTAHHP